MDADTSCSGVSSWQLLHCEAHIPIHQLKCCLLFYAQPLCASAFVVCTEERKYCLLFRRNSASEEPNNANHISGKGPCCQHLFERNFCKRSLYFGMFVVNISTESKNAGEILKRDFFCVYCHSFLSAGQIRKMTRRL